LELKNIKILNSLKKKKLIDKMKKKLLSISPHFSTGGGPQVLVKRVELVGELLDVYVVEYNNYSDDYVVQKNRMKKMLSPDHFFTLGENKEEIIDIIKNIDPDYVHFEEIPELFNISHDIATKIYSKDRKYKIFETTHSSDFNVDEKIFFPDKFLFVSQYNCYKFNKFGIPTEVIEYPVEKKMRDDDIKNASMKKLKLDPKFKHVVNVGLFTPRKNQAYAFDIARKISNLPIKFHFIGNQADNFKAYWEPLLKNKPDNCILWGERDDVDTFLDACDLFLFTSMGFRWNKELNPLVIKEALEHQIPQFIFPLDVYNRKYDTEDTINYMNGDSDIDAGLIKNFLFPREIKTDKKYKIRAVHILLEEDDRKSKSVQQLSELKNYGIDYVQHINKRYTKTPPTEFCARHDAVGRIGSYSLRGPHYGNYQSFKKAIFKEFTDDIDFLILFESDCVLNVSIEEFVDKIFMSCDIINSRNIYYMSFGDNRNLRTGEMVSDNHGDVGVDWMYLTKKIIGIQSIMFPKFARDFILRAYETTNWDVTDLMYNEMFSLKTKAIAPRLTTQIEGVSTIQGENIEHFLLKNVSNFVIDKNKNDVIIELNENDNRFYFCLSDFYQNDIEDIKIIVDGDDNKNVYSVNTSLSPHVPRWIEVYDYKKFNEIYFNIYYKEEFLFKKSIRLSDNKETQIPYTPPRTTSNIIKSEDFKLDYKINENKLYLPYYGNNLVILDVTVKDIDTKEDIYSVDRLEFNKGNSINWISPKGYNQYEKEPDFCGYTVSYKKNGIEIFSLDIRLRDKNQIVRKEYANIIDINPSEVVSVNDDENKDKDNVYLVLAYPDTAVKEDITHGCIDSIKKSNKKIILASHHPVSKDIQNKIDYFIYDSYNPLIQHSLYNFYWSEIPDGKVEINLDKLQKKDNLNQSLTVLNNIENAIRFANKIGFKNVISISYDFIFSDEDLSKIDSICEKINKGDKMGYFMSYNEGDMKLLKSVFFVVNSNFYIHIFNNPRTPDNFNKDCEKICSHNFLENYYYKKLIPYSDQLIIEDTDETNLFNKSKINIFSGVEYLAVLPVINNERKSFIVWFNSSNDMDNRRIEFVYDNKKRIESNTHFIKDRTYYFKKITLNDDDDYTIMATFIDSKTNKIIETQEFKVNNDNYKELEKNGRFIEKNNIN